MEIPTVLGLPLAFAAPASEVHANGAFLLSEAVPKFNGAGGWIIRSIPLEYSQITAGSFGTFIIGCWWLIRRSVTFGPVGWGSLALGDRLLGFEAGQQFGEDNTMGVEHAKVAKEDSKVQSGKGVIKDGFAKTEVVWGDGGTRDEKVLDIWIGSGSCNVLEDCIHLEDHQDGDVVMGGMLVDPVLGIWCAKGGKILFHEEDDKGLVMGVAAGKLEESLDVGDGGKKVADLGDGGAKCNRCFLGLDLGCSLTQCLLALHCFIVQDSLAVGYTRAVWRDEGKEGELGVSVFWVLVEVAIAPLETTSSGNKGMAHKFHVPVVGGIKQVSGCMGGGHGKGESAVEELQSVFD